jgi:hypothetical protein
MAPAREQIASPPCPTTCLTTLRTNYYARRVDAEGNPDTVTILPKGQHGLARHPFRGLERPLASVPTDARALDFVECSALVRGKLVEHSENGRGMRAFPARPVNPSFTLP